MAFHSAQGPQLGLPQMISPGPVRLPGRAAGLAVRLRPVRGFNVFNTILGGKAMSTTAHGSTKL